MPIYYYICVTCVGGAMPVGRQIIGGREYVYEYKSVWNKEKKRSEQKRDYIGRIIDGEFVPNKKYLLREMNKQKESASEDSALMAFATRRTFAGGAYLFDRIGDALGITEDIQACFPDFYREILTLAYYLGLESGTPMTRLQFWTKTHEHPFGEELTVQRISELLPQIPGNGISRFFRRQSDRRAESEFLFFGSTSPSSLSEFIEQIRYGHNKDGNDLALTSLALLFGRNSRLPVYYRQLPGKLTDVMMIEQLLSEIADPDLPKVTLVLDQGFYSQKNLNSLFAGNHEFILGAGISLAPVQKQLDASRRDFTRRKNRHADTGLFMVSERVDLASSRGKKNASQEQPVFMHMYYCEQLAGEEKTRFYRMLDEYEAGFHKKKKGAAQKRFEKYYESDGPSGETRQNQLAIDATVRNFGYFVLISNHISDPAEALKIYRLKDMTEKAFTDIKGRIDISRMSISSDRNLEARLFIQFVALIYLSYVKHTMARTGLSRNYTMQEVFDELNLIGKFEQPGLPAYFGKPGKKHKELYTAFGVKPPA